jgi:hypothetical protein
MFRVRYGLGMCNRHLPSRRKIIGVFETGEFYRWPGTVSREIWMTYYVPNLEWQYITSPSMNYYYASFPDFNSNPNCAMIYYFDTVQQWILRYIDQNGNDQQQTLGSDTFIRTIR